MVFNSFTFLIFLGVVLLLYYRLGHRGQNWMLILASYLFYGWWDFRFAGLLFFTTCFDYGCALWIDAESRPRRRRWYLASSMVVNLGVLCLFKYFNFFTQSLQSSLAVLGITLSFPMQHIVLPVGISFYTFLSMSYTIDVYRRELPATRRLTDFVLYVSFFPHLVAGPIVRASLLLPQCQRPRKVIPEEVANGLWLMLMGYVKKVVIADRLAQVVNWGFAQNTPPLQDANSWLVLYAFAFQIYGDFSGYSDVARGLAKLMGFELVENFRAPYLVTNPSSFWRHWHISLSTWLRDYLYVPLGGNRRGRLKTYRNLMLTMLLGGLWHGAGAAYVLWGLYHGTLLALQRFWQELTGRPHHRGSSTPPDSPLSSTHAVAPGNGSAGEPVLTGKWFGLPRLKRALLVVLFFHITCVGWLLFRAGSLPASVSQVAFVREFLKAMVTLPAHLSPLLQGVALLGLLCLWLQWKHQRLDHFANWPLRWQSAGVVAALAVLSSLGIFEGAQFIYFQF